MTAAERVTFERLEQENQELRARVTALEETIRELQQQRQELQAKLDEQVRAAARATRAPAVRSPTTSTSKPRSRSRAVPAAAGRWRPLRPSSSSSRTCH